MKPLWVVQKFAVHDDDGKGMKEAIESLGLQLHILPLPPFDYDRKIDPPKYDGPVIPYGGTKFIDSIKDDKRWFCVFNDNFLYSIAVEHLGERMFNADGKFMKMREFCPSMYKGEKYVFIRPDKDTKEFAGNTVKPEQFMQWYRQIEAKGMGVSEDTDILVAEASRIDEEWRMFVVDNEIVGGSRYRIDHRLSISADVPDEVYNFVRETIKIWQPAPFFVMDICNVSGTLHVLEIGDLHSAGWYETNKRDVIDAVSRYVEEHSTPM
jgi:hypothetical protein